MVSQSRPCMLLLQSRSRMVLPSRPSLLAAPPWSARNTHHKPPTFKSTSQKMPAARWLLALCAPLAAEGIALASGNLGAQRAAAKAKAKTVSAQALRYFQALNASSSRRPVLVPPGDVRARAEAPKPGARHVSLLEVGSQRGEFQPSAEFQAGAEGKSEAALPWGVGTPRGGDNWVVHEYSAMHMLDVPHWVEYSLETGDNIQTFSSAWQDVKLITQVLENVTNGFYLDTHGGDGETNSYTLLLEITGWRGLILEPQIYEFATLWGKMRKAWLFLGCLSPTGNATKLGFDTDGVLDMLSGHQIHAYNLPTFLEEMGGRKTIDFWAVHNGHYEAEVLNETFFGTGKNIEFGVVLVRFNGRNAGRGSQWFAQHRSKDETEELVFEIMHNASFNYIGGLDAFWINYVEPRFHYNDHVWVNPAYFERRGIPIPTWCKSAPPPALEYPRQGHLDVPGLDNLKKWTGSGSSPGPHVYGHPTDMTAGSIPHGYGSPGIPYGPSSRNPFGIDHQEYDDPAYMSLGSSNPSHPGPQGGGGTWDPRWNWDAGYTYEEDRTRHKQIQ
ncbi:unnamed protein product [Prorocentrum cordatum]|uniref:Phospholipase B-like n=1 Tax=Prorocentrum cordatum TaxID=2364126 RepID=A0ABN9VG78_9DINO|nr:unnamed protein product [Polarella glacialis]